jgi:YegS/Rv2252/BmrU family lipid kinase
VEPPIRLIVNPAAGGGKPARLDPPVWKALDAHGLACKRVDTRSLDHARELARTAAQAGQTVVAVGGDGLVGALADALRSEPGSVLGVIPAGRGNDLARVLGIPEDVRAAAAVIAAGHTRAVDLGFVSAAGEGGTADGRAFVGIASVGFDSDANRIANEAPPWLGGLVYGYGALRALAAWRHARFEIELDPPGERVSFSGYSVGAANSKAYGGGMRAAPGALLDDGMLEVVLLESVSKVGFLTRILPNVFRGTHVDEPEVRVLKAREILVSADRPFTMYADGDPIGELPVRVRALQGAVSMLVPRDMPSPSPFATASQATAPDGSVPSAPDAATAGGTSGTGPATV